MDVDKIIKGRYVLIVDDEQDVLDTLCDLLAICKIDMADSFEKAKEMLEDNHYDIAILDIMGVDGYALLETANDKGVPAIMLTAHAMSEDNLVKSAEQGAVYFAPKEELINIKEIAAEVIEALDNNKSTWQKMFDRLGEFYDRQFSGPNWREDRKEFWDNKVKKLQF